MNKKYEGLQGHWFNLEGRTCVVSQVEKSGKECIVYSTCIADSGEVENKVLPLAKVLKLMEFEEVDMTPPGRIW